jgi:hypothetical protein
VSVLCPAAGIFFFPGTFLITFLFDLTTRADWKEEYGTIVGPHPSECVMSRWMQILLLVILQFVLQSLISSLLAYFF